MAKQKDSFAILNFCELLNGLNERTVSIVPRQPQQGEVKILVTPDYQRFRVVSRLGKQHHVMPTSFMLLPILAIHDMTARNKQMTIRAALEQSTRTHRAAWWIGASQRHNGISDNYEHKSLEFGAISVGDISLRTDKSGKSRALSSDVNDVARVVGKCGANLLVRRTVTAAEPTTPLAIRRQQR